MDGFFIGIGLGIVFGIIISETVLSNYPTPIDVYQGKTTLKYEVVDGVKVDSVVVWKDDFKK